MATCGDVCGTGGWTGPLPGDPDNNSILTATPAFGGIDVTWTYPVINPFAVAHTLLYRSPTPNFNGSMERQVVAGNFFYDKLDNGSTYYYWIKIVSINGTVGELIGPASATARPLIEDLIEQLTGKIDNGVLAVALKNEFSRVSALDMAVQTALTTALNGDAALAAALIGVQTSTDAVFASVADEIAARIAANVALVDALNAHASAIAGHVVDLVNADLAEADARIEAASLESIARTAQVQQAAYATLDAALAVNNAELNMASTVAIARSDLQQSIVDGVSAEATQRLLLAAKLDTEKASTLALISTESAAHVTAIDAEATQRGLLAAQFRGAYTGTDPALLTQGLLYNERVMRVTEQEALAQQITLLSAGAGEQFDWVKIWYFDSGLENWTGNGVPTATMGWIRPADQASGAYVESPAGIETNGTKYSQIRLRIRKVGTPTFLGSLQWQGAADTTWDVPTRTFALTAPVEYINGIGLITVNPGWTVTVDKIRIALSDAQTATDYFEIDWVAIGRPSPGASSAQLLTEQMARINKDQSIVDDYVVLNAKVGDTTTGIIKDIATIVRDYSTTATAASATAQAQTALLAHFGPSMVFREAGTAQVTGADTNGPAQVVNYTPIILKDGTTAYLPKISVGNTWYNTANGNKPHTWAGVDGWVYTPDLSPTATDAFIDRLDTAFADAGNATTSAIMDAVSSVNDPVTGLLVTQAAILEEQTTQADLLQASANSTQTLVSKSKETDDALLTSILNGEASRTLLQGTIAVARQEMHTDIVDGLSAEASARLALVAVVNDKAALLDEETRVRVANGLAMATRVDTIKATVEKNSANILDVQTANTSATQALASAVTALAATIGTKDAITAATLVDAASVIATDTLAESQKRATLQSMLDGHLVSAQTNLQTDVETIDGKVVQIGARYTANVTVDGLIGGFGVYNDGEVVEAGFDVDTFWVGRTSANKRKPFIIVNNETFIDEAVIRDLTFTKLRDETGAFIVENGKVKADYINARGLTVTSDAGVVGLQVDTLGNTTFGGTLAIDTGSANRLVITSDKIEVWSNNVRRVVLGNLS